MTNKKDYKPCRFCGKSEQVFQERNHLFKVVCFMCGANGPVSSTREEAIKAWNSKYPKRLKLFIVGGDDNVVLAQSKEHAISLVYGKSASPRVTAIEVDVTKAGVIR